MDATPSKPLTFGEAIRRRPGMYLGDPGPEALQYLIDELVSNAIDQFLMGRATTIDVRVLDDGGIEIGDDGAGLPFDEPAPDGSASLATRWFTTPHHTARADGHAHRDAHPPRRRVDGEGVADRTIGFIESRLMRLPRTIAASPPPCAPRSLSPSPAPPTESTAETAAPRRSRA